jgi:hypothetical protein
MSKRRSVTTVIAGALLVSGCATPREIGFNGEVVYQVSEVEVPPRLIGCSNYDPVSAGVTRPQQLNGPQWTTVRVSLIVSPNGSVDPRSPTATSTDVPPQTQTDVEALARGCSYTPAWIGDDPVPVRLSALFRVERPATPARSRGAPRTDTLR